MFEVTRIAQLLGHKAAIYALSPYQSPSQFLSAAGDGWIVAWDLDNLPNGKLIATVEDNIFSLLYVKEKHIVIVGTMNGYVIWINLENNAILHKSLAHSKGVYAIYKDENNNIFTAGGDGKISLWNIETFQKRESLQLAYQSLRCISALGENTLAIGCSDGNIYTINCTDFTALEPIIKAHNNSVFSLYLDKSQKLWSGGRDAQLKTWDSNTKNNLQTQPAHLFTVNSICGIEHLNIIATASRDKTVKLWNENNMQILKVLDTIRNGMHVRSINALLYMPLHQCLITASDDKSLGIWQIEKS